MNTKELKIFQPITIKSMTMKNRLGNAPFGNIPMGDGDGYICDDSLKNIHSLVASDIGLLMCGVVRCRKAKGGLIGSGNAVVDGKKSAFSTASIADDSYIPGWKRLADYAHSFGCCLGVQLGEYGPQALNALSEQYPEYQKYKMTTLGGDDSLPPMHVWTAEELDELCESVAQSARRAKEAGLDCVEIHCAHSSGLLYATALNPFFNHRTDEYGGNLEKSFHMLEKTIKRMRELVGENYPILVRINCDDLMGTMGHTLDDHIRYIIPKLEELGVDAIDLSQGGPSYTSEGPNPAMYYPRAMWLPMHRKIKEATKLPVIGVGRITTMEMAAKYVEDGSVDIMYMGREIFADGQVVHNYLRDGNDGCTRQCISCMTSTCKPCAVNFKERYPAVPGNAPLNDVVTDKPKKILVIGGGVAGMEAARVAAELGHNVTLWEREGRLGGNIGLLATVPLTSEFQNIIDFQEQGLGRAGVDVRCCYEATLEKVKAFNPDVVFLATGFDMPLPESVKGGLMVMDHLTAIKRRREFRSLDEFRKKVVIYGFFAAELALDLAKEGCDVTLMGPGGENTVAAEAWVTRERKMYLKRKLTDINYIRERENAKRVYNPTMYYRAKLEGVDKDGVHFFHNGIHKTMPYDVLIVSGGRKKNDEMFEALQQIVPKVIKIGDCDKAGIIKDAITAANLAVRSL